MVLSVVAMSAAFAGGAAADHEEDWDNTFDDLFEDDTDFDDVYIGQNIEIASGEIGDAVRIYNGFPSDHEANDDVMTVWEDDAGFAVDADNFDHNEPYYFEEDGDKSNVFRVLEQDIGVEFSSPNAPAIDDATTLEYESANRDDGVTLEISMEHEGDALSGDDVADIIGASGDYTHDDFAAVDVSVTDNEGGVDFDLSSADLGDYNVTVSVADTTAEETVDLTVIEADDPQVLFDANNYAQEVGDVAEFKVDFVGGATDAHLTIEDSESEYSATLDFAVDDPTEPVNVSFDTYKAGDGTGDAFELENVDWYDVDNEEDIGDFKLIPDTYTLEVGQDDEFTDDVAFLSLNERSTGEDISTWTVPAAEDPSGDLEDIFTEHASSTDTFAEEDYLIAEIEASGISYAFDNGNWDADDEDGLELWLNSTQTPRYGTADTVDLTQVQQVQFVPMPDDNKFYVFTEVGDHLGDDSSDVLDDYDWELTFKVTDANPYVADGEEEVASTTINADERNVNIVGATDEDGNLYVQNQDGVEIEAESNVAPGTQVEYRVQFPGGVQMGDAEVGADGTFAAAFDASGAEDGELIDPIRVTELGISNGASDEMTGVITGDELTPASIQTSADAPADVEIDGAASLDVTIENAGQQDSDEFDYEVVVGGDTVAEGSMDLEGGDSWSDSFDFDTSEEAEIDWSVTVDGDTDSGTLEVYEPEVTDDDADDTADDGDGVPGFGVAVALVALLAAAMLAIRRQD